MPGLNVHPGAIRASRAYADSMDVAVKDNPEEQRYEAWVDGERAGFITYRREPDGQGGEIVTLPHTEVDPSFEGKGIGSILARDTLDDLHAAGVRVRPTCPFLARYVTLHPEYADLVAH